MRRRKIEPITNLSPPISIGAENPLVTTITETFTKYKHRRQSHERYWFRNLLFLLGQQWIKWDESENRWRKKKLESWVPTPVTNKFSANGERLVSILSRIEPNWLYAPSSEDYNAITAAQVCDDIEDIICEENNITGMRDLIARWLVYTGNVFLFPWAEAKTSDPSSLMGQAPLEYKLYTDILSPFEVYGDMTISEIENQEKVLLISRKDKEYVKRLYGISPEEDRSELGINYLEAIGYMTEESGYTEYRSGKDDRIPRCTIKRLIQKPNDEYPDGLYAVQVGTEIVEELPLPKSPEGETIWPIIQMKFDPVVGSMFGKSPMNSLVPKQIQRNKLESLIELIAIRMSNPVWVVPETTVVRGFSGQPGAILKYSDLTGNSNKPDRIPGEQIPTTLITWLEQIDKDMEELSALFDALKGQSPYSGAPGVVVDQLVEQGMNRFGPSLRNIAEGYRKWMKAEIELFRLYAVTPRFIASRGENAKWKVSKFSGADILSAVDVRVESDSTVPRSDATESAKTLAAVNSNLVDIADPLIRLKVLQKLHLTDLADTIDSDVLAAVREHEFVMSGQMIAVSPFLDNHEIHVQKHRSFANSDEGQQFKELMLQHITEHHMIMDAQMQPTSPMQTMGGQATVTPEAQETLAPT